MHATNLPGQYAAGLGAQQQHAVLLGEGDAVDALGEGHEGLLVALVPAVDVHDGLVLLGGEDVRAAHGQAVLLGRALLEDMALCGQRLQLVHEDGRVLGHACVCLCVRGNGRDKVLGEHRGSRARGMASGAGAGAAIGAGAGAGTGAGWRAWRYFFLDAGQTSDAGGTSRGTTCSDQVQHTPTVQTAV